MEELRFALFILALLAAAFFVTQIIRRDFNSRKNLRSDLRRESMRVRPGATACEPRTLRASEHARERRRKQPLSRV